MFLIVNFLIYLGCSTISYQDSTLTITDEATIDSSQIDQYKSAQTCVITSSGDVAIQSGAFNSFTSLKQLSIQVGSITFATKSFQQMSGINELAINATNSIDLAQGSFQLSGIDHIVLNAGNKVTFGTQSFQSTNTISQLNVSSNGTVTIGEESFMKSLIKSIHIQSKGAVVVGVQAFQGCEYINTLHLESKEAGITFDPSSFQNAIIQLLILQSHDDVTFAAKSMDGDVNSLIIETQGNFIANQHSFKHSNINDFYVRTNGYATFEKQVFQQTLSLNNFTVISNQDITFAQHSFLHSTVNSMLFISNQSISFGQQCFQQTSNLDTFVANATGELFFDVHSFLGSSINSISLNTTGPITFSKQSFQNCLSLTSFVIQTPSDVTFGPKCFHNSQVHELDIIYPNQNSSLVQLSSASTVTFEKQSFAKCSQLKSVDINTQGNVDIQSNSFTNSKSLDNVKITANGKATVAAYAFSGCKSLGKADISAGQRDVSDDAYANGGDDGGDGDDDDDDDGDENGGKKKSGSSHKDNDDDSQQNAKLLGNIDIETVYLGTSPNIYFNLNFLLGLMKKVRQAFGRVVPAPEFVHSAIWVGRKDATDDTLGAIFVYGKYWNKNNLPSYIDRDGAKACLMSLKDFKKRYPSIDPMKLNPKRKMKLFDFINEVKNSGNWRASDYNWPTNNCQHFTSKLISILECARANPNENDWIDLPKPVLNSLKSNEK